ncbi:hypothetical protein ABW19_dt0209179 [Dactylella cylindrospora]|nr:hypothetical protein ABW19_dt0209179 [Dactylella cylindrospora]
MKGTVLSLLSGAAVAYAQVNTWGQCGGIGYTGSSVCVAGASCSTLNPYYAQCLPGGPAPTTSQVVTTPVVTTASRTTLSTSRTAISTTASRTTALSTTRLSSTAPQPTTGGLGPGSTLISPYIWIRAVVSPYYHKYLQSEVLRSPGSAVLGDYTTAGQFDVVNGQLVQLIDTSGTLLYGYIEEKTSDSQTKLQLTWGTTPSSYGTFAWSGDALLWSHPSVSRQNNGAWLICESAKVYANLGAYGYMTPAGCSDATIHFYNGATAVDK